MKKRFLTLSVILFLLGILPISSFAQSKINIFLDYHYQFGLFEKAGYSISRKDSKMYGNSLHLSTLYNFTQQLSAGVGVGADRYENPGYNTFPLFASLHYAPLKKHTDLYAFTNIGYAVIGKQETYTGMMWDLGIGYKKMFRSHFGLNFQFGYNLKQFRNINSDVTSDIMQRENSTRSSLSLGIGVIF